MAKGIASGARRWLVTFQRATVARDAHGQETESAWANLASTRAAVMHGRGTERREAAAEGSARTATFIVLRSASIAGVTARDRILMAGEAWDIHSIAPSPSGRTIEFTATARGA